jgi:hypothetical protein
MVSFEGLSVRLSAQTTTFRRGISAAKNSVQDLSTTLRRLGVALSATERKLESTGRSAFGVIAAFSGLSIAANSLGVSLGGMSLISIAGGFTAVTAAATALLSTLFPLAAVVGTLAGGVGALATAFGAVVGTGILAFGEQRGEQNRERIEEINNIIANLKSRRRIEGELSEQDQERLRTLKEEKEELSELTGITGGLQDVLSELKAEITPLIVEFGQQFIPLIEDAVDALPELVENILDAVGGFETFTEAAREFGEEAFEVLPQLFADIIDFAREALPVFIDGLRWLRNNAGSIFRGMLRVTRALAPVFLDFFRAFVNATPELTRLGSVVLSVLIPALSQFLNTVEDIIQIGAGSDSITDFVSSLITRAQEWFQNTGKQQLTALGDSLLSELTSALSPSDDGEDGESSLLQAIINRIGSVLNDVATWLNEEGGSEQIQSLATSFLADFAEVFEGDQDEKASGVVDTLTRLIDGIFDTLLGIIESEEAGRASQAIGAFVAELLSQIVEAAIAYVNSEEFLSDMLRLANAIRNTFGAALVQAFPGAILELLGADVKPAGAADIQFDPNQQIFGTTARATGTQTQFNEENLQVEVTVEGDTAVVENVAAETANQELDRQSDQAQRNTGSFGIGR